MLLFYLLFEENSENYDLVKLSMENATDFDYLVYIMIQKLDPISYFDATRIHKLKDKLSP
jgi:hypothetical protein